MKHIIGIFQDRGNAERAIRHVEERGYPAKDISIIMKDQVEGREMAADTGATMADGVVSGATTGALVGGLAGFLTGIGAIAIPGIGGFLIGGPLAAALGLTGAAAATASGAATGALAGGILGALMGLGIPREDAQVYERHINEGAILLMVPARADEVTEVRRMLMEDGATDIRTITMEERFDESRSVHTHAGM